jgi:hypothetical protein
MMYLIVKMVYITCELKRSIDMELMEVKFQMTKRSFEMLMEICQESDEAPYAILDELICGSPEYGIDEFNKES